jgi:hypothetical protein
MTPSASPRRRTLERGEISWVTMLLLVVLLGVGYLAVVWGPVYLVRYEAKLALQAAINQARKDQNDAELVQRMCSQLASLDTVKVKAADGTVQQVPAVDVAPRDVTWERDNSANPPTLHVAFEYTHQVSYPFLDRVDQKTFSLDMTSEIAIQRW